jgi:hypothetical protein
MSEQSASHVMLALALVGRLLSLGLALFFGLNFEKILWVLTLIIVSGED